MKIIPDNNLRQQLNLDFIHSIAVNLSDIIAVYDAEGRYRYISPAAQKVLGYAPDERLGTYFYNYLHPDDVPRIRALFAGIVAGSPAAGIRTEYRVRRKDGGYAWLQTEPAPILDDAGKFVQLLVISRDITGDKQRENARREYENRLRTFAQAIPDISMIIDEDGRYLEVFAANERLLVRPKDEYAGLTLHQIHPAPDADFLLAEIRQTFRTGTPRRYSRELIINGMVRVTEGRMAPMGYLADGKRTVAVVITDITEQRRADSIMKQIVTLRRRTEFINDILRGETLDARMMATAKVLDFDFALPLFCCLIHVEPENGPWPENDVFTHIFQQSNIIDLLSSYPQLFVWDCHGDIGVICLRGGDSAAGVDAGLSVASRLLKTIKAFAPHLKATIGVSDTHRGPDSIRRSYRQAASAAAVARSQGADGQEICHFRHLGIYQFLAHISDDELAREFVADKIGKLIDHDAENHAALLPTLEEILRSANLKEAAQRLYLHYNTAIFRKRRIEKILGVSLDDFETRLALSAAIKLHRLKL